MAFKLADAYVEIRSNMARMSAGMAAAQSRLVTGLRGMAASASGAFTALTGMSSLMGGGLLISTGLAIRQFGKWEEKLRELEFVLDGNADTARKFGEEIRRLSRETGTSSNEIADGLNELIDAGVDASDALDAITASTKGAIGAGADLAEVNSGLVSLMLAYGLRGKQAIAVMDSMIASTKAARTSLSGMSQGMVMLAPRAKQLGIHFTEMQAGLATLTQSGFSFSASTQLMAAVLRDLYLKQQMVAKGRVQLSVDVSRERIASEGLLGVLKDLAAAHGTQTSSIASSFYTFRGLNALVENLTKYEANLNSALNSGGRTIFEYQRSMRTVNRQLAVMGARLKDVAVTVGGVFIGAWRGASDVITAFANGLGHTVVDAFNAVVGAGSSFLSDWESLSDSLSEGWEGFLDALATSDLIVEQVGVMLLKWWDGVSVGLLTGWDELVIAWDSLWIDIGSIADKGIAKTGNKLAGLSLEIENWVLSAKQLLGFIDESEANARRKTIEMAYGELPGVLKSRYAEAEERAHAERKALLNKSPPSREKQFSNEAYRDALIDIDERLKDRLDKVRKEREGRRGARTQKWKDLTEALLGTGEIGDFAHGLSAGVAKAVSSLLSPTAISGVSQLAVSKDDVAKSKAERQREMMMQIMKEGTKEVVQAITTGSGVLS